MQDDEEFSRKYTREELEDALNLDMYRILSNQIDHSALKARIDYLLAVESQLATVTAQRDELLAAISKCLSESNACVGGIVELSAQLGKIRAISNAAIAKCEVKNDA